MAAFRKKKTITDSRLMTKAVNREWKRKVLSYARNLRTKLSKTDWARLKALLGLRAYAGPIRGSDLAARRQAGLLCAEVVYSQWLSVRKLRWFHITLLADEFQLLERRPGLAIKRLRGKAYKEIQDLGLNALVWIDVHPLLNHPQKGEGGMFLFHIHAVAFTDHQFDVAAARRQLAASRSWSCSLGARPTDISEITRKMGTPAWWAAYDAQPPHDGKNVVVQSDGSVKLMSTRKGYRPQIAMRLAEGLAQLGLLDLMFSVGEGKDLREEVRKSLAKWHRKRWPDERAIDDFDVASIFKRLWKATRVRRYKRWRIVGFLV